LKVLALCENPRSAARLEPALGRLPGITVDYAVCRAEGVNRILHTARLVGGPLSYRWSGIRHTVRLVQQGRLHLFDCDLHHPRFLAWISRHQYDVGLHAAGVIYRQPLIDAFRSGILNAHIGLLPRFRGRSVMEWAVFEGFPTGVTTFLIDRGIDTGPQLVLRCPIDISQQRSQKSAIASLRASRPPMYGEALRILAEGDASPLLQRPEEGRRYYPISQLLGQVVDQLIEEGYRPRFAAAMPPYPRQNRFKPLGPRF